MSSDCSPSRHTCRSPYLTAATAKGATPCTKMSKRPRPGPSQKNIFLQELIRKWPCFVSAFFGFGQRQLLRRPLPGPSQKICFIQELIRNWHCFVSAFWIWPETAAGTALAWPQPETHIFTRLDKELALFSATPVLGFGQAVPESGLRAAAGRCACGKCKDLGDVKTLGDATSVHSTKHFTSPSPTEI